MATTPLPRPAFGPSPYLVRDLLESYTTSHPLRSPSPLPPSSRVNPKLTQRLPPVSASVNPFVWTIPTWISFVRFAVAKGVHVIWSLVKHFLWGPARRSWGYRMTLVRDSRFERGGEAEEGRSHRLCGTSRIIRVWRISCWSDG